MNVTELPEDIRAWLETAPQLTKAGLEELREAGEALDADPGFRAELIKGRFVSEILTAMEEKGQSQAEVARAWGRTRQYLNKLLNEDKRVNFTVETLCELAHLLDRRIDVKVLRTDEVAHVMRCVSAERTLLSPEAAWNSRQPFRSPVAPPPVGEFDHANVCIFTPTTAPNDPTSLAA